MSSYEEQLRQNGLKVTTPRVRILYTLDNTVSHHMSAEDLHAALKAEATDVSLATVYRVLNQLEEAGLLIKHNFIGGHAVYELAAREHHDHLVCTRCHRIEEFHDKQAEERLTYIANRHQFTAIDHQLTLYGICEDCTEN